MTTNDAQTTPTALEPFAQPAFGLSVRWSLADAPDDVAAKLSEYVRGASVSRFTGMVGLGFKTWRMRAGEWFEGTYVWADESARDRFAADFAATGSNNPGSQLIGSGPTVIECFEVVAIAEGAAGFRAS